MRNGGDAGDYLGADQARSIDTVVHRNKMNKN